MKTTFFPCAHFAKKTRVVIAGISLLAASQSFGALIHEYNLNGTLADSFGGPSLTTNGGTLNAADYSFDVNQGLSLVGALPSIDNYSILVDFSLTLVNGFRRLVDFQNRASDTGLYNLNSALSFYNVTTGPDIVFAPNVKTRVVITRDGTSGVFTGYVNGVPEISFIDTGNLAVFNTPGALINFFIDDLAVGGEASAGVADEIAIFDSPLSAGDVAALGGPGVPVPEPGAFALAALGVSFVMNSRRTRRKISR